MSIARLLTVGAAMWLIIVAVTGISAGKVVLPMSLMMLGLGFLSGYSLGHSERP